jgi:DNA repair protein RadD
LLGSGPLALCACLRCQPVLVVREAYPNAILLGLTATPCRGDGRGLGGIFEVIVECPQVAELTAQGYLVKTRVFAPIDPDLKGVETRSGDYVGSTALGRR